MIKSLDELKAENAKAEEEVLDNQDVATQDELDDEISDNDTDVDADNLEETDTVDGSEETEELESWQQTEEGDSSENDQTGFKPNAEAAKKRKQNKALRGQVKEQQTENELLRKEIEALKAGVAPAQVAPEQKSEPMPTLEAHGYDDASYNKAMVEWQRKEMQKASTETYQQALRKEQEDKQLLESKQALQKNLDDHYARAGKLVDEGKVKQENYQNADTNVRRTLDTVFPNAGDQMTDQIIATLNKLGAGSEKVMYQLGVNESKLGQLASMLKDDSTGLQAMAYLGKLHAEIQSPAKSRSNAPKPSTKISGDSQVKSSSKLQKQYSKATNLQERLDLKRSARKAGEDVSKW
mgnify:CR=1 FL=1